MNKGLMIVVSGPAGSGKGTVNAHLLAREDFCFSVSATTRAPRPGEINGKHYHFISKEDFLVLYARCLVTTPRLTRYMLLALAVLVLSVTTDF